MSTVEWQELGDVDQRRLHRLKGVIEPGRAGLDPDGWLVTVSPDGKEFACEWPVSGDPDPSLTAAVIRADRPANGPTPVFVEYPDGRLQLLPSAPGRLHGNAYTWGYSGTGPSNLAGATLDLLRRADDCADIGAEGARNLIRSLVAKPHLPSWPVQELLSDLSSPRIAKLSPVQRRANRRP